MCRYGCCSNFWELLACIKILWYIINIIITVLVKVYGVWSCIFKDMDFWSSLFYFRIKLVRYCFNLWELLDCNKIPKILLKIPHNIFQFFTKFHEFWRCTSIDMNFWNNSSVLRKNSTIALIFVERRLCPNVYMLVYVWECLQRYIYSEFGYNWYYTVG